MTFPLPTFEHPVSQPVNTNQFFEPAFKKWALNELQWQFGFNRKLWEYSYILQSLKVNGKLNGRGLGFGVGEEPVVPVMLRHGAQLVATDLNPGDARSRGWDPMKFDVGTSANLQIRHVNMNCIPSDLCGFDFVWSCGSLEHIGGHAAGLNFVERAMACLKPGGIAVHTTELMYDNDEYPFDSPNLSIYRGSDIQELAARLRDQGHCMELNLQFGTHVLDSLVSDEGSPWELMMRERVAGRVITSVGLIVRSGCSD